MATSTCRECTELERMTYSERRAADGPTNWWHCQHCNRHLDRYRGMSDQQCTCGTWYNAGGQRLRTDWTDNPAWRNDDIDDLEGYELASLAKETGGGRG